MNREISQRIKLFGFMMSCAIAVGHSYYTGAESGINLDMRLNTYIVNVCNGFSNIAMNYFFLVSAYLLFRTLTFGNYWQKIKRRLYTFMVPYLLWQVIFVIIHAIRGYGTSLEEFISTVFLFSDYPPDGGLWYMYIVFLLALLSPLLLLAFRNEKVGFAAIMLMIVSIAAVKKALPGSAAAQIMTYGYLRNTFTYVGSYLFGAFFGYFDREMTEHRKMQYMMLAIVAAFFLELTFLSGFITSMVFCMAPAGLIFLWPIKIPEKEIKVFRVSFLVYATHAAVLGAYNWPLSAFLEARIPYMCVNQLILRAVLLGSEILLATVIYVVLAKLAPKLLQVLTGGRAIRTIQIKADS